MREKKVNITQNLSWQARRWSDERKWATQKLTSLIRSPGEVSDKQLTDAYFKVERRHERYFTDMHENVMAAKRFGYTDDEIFSGLYSLRSGVNPKVAYALQEGKYLDAMWYLDSGSQVDLQRSVDELPENERAARQTVVDERIKLIQNLVDARMDEVQDS